MAGRITILLETAPCSLYRAVFLSASKPIRQAIRLALPSKGRMAEDTLGLLKVFDGEIHEFVLSLHRVCICSERHVRRWASTM